MLPDDEVDPESAVGPLVLLPELLLLLPELLLPAVLPLFDPVPPLGGVDVAPEEFAVDPDGLDDLPALDDPDWLA